MFQGNVFRLKMFVIALFTSDVGVKHVSFIMVVNFGFAMRCCTLVTVVINAAMFSQIFCFLPRPIFQLATWSHNSPNVGCFGHSPPLWSDHD